MKEPVKVGDVFGRLKVLYKCDYQYHGPNRKRANLWHVQCQCENKTEFDVLTHSLTSGNTRSCGCLQKEAAIESGKKRRKLNKYDLSGEYGIGYTSKNEPFYFDLEDYDKIKEYVWVYNKEKYPIATVYKNNQPHCLHLKRFVLDITDSKIDVDHKNHVPYDCRKENLKPLEHYQNIGHCKIYTNNTSGVKGVSYDKVRNKWKASLVVNKETKLNKRFDTFEEAVKARQDAEEKYQQGFRYNPDEDLYNRG